MTLVIKTTNRKFVMDIKKDILEELAEVIDRNNIKQEELIGVYFYKE
ncbi:MAG: hypothetical protein E7K85_04830 [Clostridium sp.]|nr:MULTISPECIES: hypothetical protein [Clostridium]MDB2119602.1 hypothetical protein [Clostridium paraputrificum]MDU2754184.1 hypothetical protein [Clostridium sp.]MDU2899913.1 hypothetical protein [Clostridium sp.]MDU4426861.1 hypothetical protein [Clostridium sp.]MDU5741249.1 hypothetical protein [Clostridium sp.]